MISELELSELPQVLPLFEAFPYDAPALQHVLQDPTLRLFANDVLSPHAALLCPQQSDISFVAGNAQYAPQLIDYMLEIQENAPRLRFLSLPSQSWREQVNAAFPKRFFEKHRVSYSLEDAAKTQNWESKVPAHLKMQRIDKTLAEQAPQACSRWFGGYWPDAKQFALQGIGYCLLQEERIVSLAYSAYPISKMAEIVVETDKEFQGQGLAPLCCAPFIQECLSRNIEPLYSADRGHLASTSVAKKIGFGNEKHHCWLSGFR